MKIASQLQSAEPSTSTKATVSPDGAADFRDALATVKIDTTPVHGAERKPEKSQTPENKKKTQLADSSINHLHIELTPAPKVASPSPAESARTVSSSALPSNQTAVPSGNVTAASPSLSDMAELGPFIGTTASYAKPLTSTNLVGTPDPGAMIGNLDSSAAPTKAYENAASVDRQQIDISPTVLQADQAPPAYMPVAATPPVDSSNADALLPVLSADSSKASSISNPSTSTSIRDSSTPAAPIAPAVTASTIAALMPLPGLISNNEANPSSKRLTSQSGDTDKATNTPKNTAFAQIASAMNSQPPAALLVLRESPGNGVSTQPMPPVMTGISPTLKSAGANAKDTPTPEVTSVLKSKPKSSFSDLRDNGDGDKISADEPANGTEESASFAKTLEVATTPGHSAGDNSGAINSAVVQQPAPSGLSVPNHSPQITQISGGQIEARVPLASGSAPVDSQAMQGVTSAQLTQSMRSSEMKLGMQSAEFGNISITTSLNRQAISAQISIDHSELGRALAVHLPAIEEKLGSAYGVQAKVELRESYNPALSGDSGYSNSGQQSRDRRQSEQGGSTPHAGAMFERSSGLSNFTATSLAASDLRLDIRI